MAGWSSTIPDTMAALLSLWQATFPGTDVLVVDGPPTGGDGQTKMACVGYDGQDGAVHAETAPAGYGDSNQESYTVFCAVIAVDGGTEWGPVRDQAFSLYTDCVEAIGQDQTLGGTVLRAMPGSIAVNQSSSPSGLRVVIAFGVQVSAFTKEAD
jgi:hypothetical protein